MASKLVVDDIMTRTVRTLREEDNLLDIARKMETYRFHHLPVEDDGKLVGLVTHRDILRLAGNALDASEVGRAREQALEEKTFVADVMTRNVRTVGPASSIAEAARILLESRIGCLPVIDDAGKLVGIVTEYDFLALTVTLLEKA